MGSVEAHADTDEEFTVLVTGFDSFKAEYPQNPSWEIARDLPAYLPARTKQPEVAGTAPAPATAAPDLPPVRIVVYPEAIRVNYQTVRKLVPTLWDGEASPGGAAPGWRPPPKIDLLLHVGMAGPRLHYALERVGRRDGYALRDVDGQLLGDTAADRADPGWPWYGVPAALESDVDLDDVLQKWRSYASPGADLRISVDAGRYLCDFIYFSSLAHLYRRDQAAGGADPRYRRRRVAFLHVPAAAAPERVAAGRALVVELIRSLVESEVAARRAGPGKDAGEAAAPSSAAAADTPAQGADTVTGKWYRD